MRSRNIELKSDLANLFKDLEEAKRESPNVVPISKPKIDQSDIKNLFSGLEEASKQARVVEKKRKDYVETTPTDISNLLKELEEASKQAKNEEPRIPRKKGQPAGSDKHSDLYTDENPKGTIHGLKFATVKDAKASVKKIDNSGKTHAHKVQAAVAMEQRAREMGKITQANVYRSYIEKMKKITKEKSKKEETIKLEALESVLTELVVDIAKDIEEEEFEILEKLDDNPKPIEVKEEVNLVNNAITHLDDKKKKKPDIKEEITDITSLRKEFDNFRSLISQQIASSQMSGAGGGEVRLEFLDDVQRTTAKVDGKFLKFDSSTGKFIGADAGGSAGAADLTGETLASGITASSITTFSSPNGRVLSLPDQTGLISLVGGITTAADDDIVLDASDGSGGDDGGRLLLEDVMDGDTSGFLSQHGMTFLNNDLSLSGKLSVSGGIDGNLLSSGNFIFEGATDDAFETALTAIDPTADRTISFPNQTGLVSLVGGIKSNADDDIVLDGTDSSGTGAGSRLLLEDVMQGDTGSFLSQHGVTFLDNNVSIAGELNIIGDLTVSGTTTTVNQTVFNVTEAFVFEGATADAFETTFSVDEPTADRKASLQDKTGTIALLSGFGMDGTDLNFQRIVLEDDTRLLLEGSGLQRIALEDDNRLLLEDDDAGLLLNENSETGATGTLLNEDSETSVGNEGDFIVLDTSDDENDRLLFEDGTTDPLAVLASHGISLVGQGWNAFRFDNT